MKIKAAVVREYNKPVAVEEISTPRRRRPMKSW